MSLIIDTFNLANIGVSYRVPRGITYGEEYVNISSSFYYILNKIAEMKTKDQDKIFFCFDPLPTVHKKSLDSTYKSNRKYNTVVLKSIRALANIFDFLKIPYYSSGNYSQGQNNYEADDYIFNIVEILKQYFPNDYHNILSTDQDLLNCVGYNDDNCVAYTCVLNFSSKGLYVDPQLFKSVGYPFNVTDAYKSINGCSSDTIKPLPNHAKIWNDYLQVIEDKKTFRPSRVNKYPWLNIEETSLIKSNVMYNKRENVLAFIEMKYPEALEQAEKNVNLVYPKFIDVQVKPFPYAKFLGLIEFVIGLSTRNYNSMVHKVSSLSKIEKDFVFNEIKNITSTSTTEEFLIEHNSLTFTDVEWGDLIE